MKSLLLLFLTVLWGGIGSSIAQQRELHFVNFKYIDTFLYQQRGLDLVGSCFRGVSNQELPVWHLQTDYTIRPMLPDTLMAHLQLHKYMPQNNGNVWATDLTYCLLDGTRPNTNSPLEIQYIHFFFAKDSMSTQKDLQNYVYSVKYTDIVAMWSKKQTPQVALNKSNVQNQLFFGQVIMPLNDSQHSLMIRQIAEAILKFQLVPFYQSNQTRIPLPVASINLLKSIVKENIDKNLFIRIQDSVTFQQRIATSLHLYTDGDYANQYKAQYIGSVSIESLRQAKPEWFYGGTAPVLMSVLAQLPNVQWLVKTLPINSYAQTVSTATPAHRTNQRFYKTFVADVDLRENKNELLVRKNKMISKLLLQQCLTQKLTAYRLNNMGWSYSTTPLSTEELLQALQVPKNTPPNIFTDEPLQIEALADSSILAVSPSMLTTQPSTTQPNDKIYKSFKNNYYSPYNLYRLQLIGRVSFDANGEHKSYHIDYLSLVLPAQYSLKGLDEVVASFKATDLQTYFESTRKAKFRYKPLRKKLTYLEGFEYPIFDYTIWESSLVLE